VTLLAHTLPGAARDLESVAVQAMHLSAATAHRDHDAPSALAANRIRMAAPDRAVPPPPDHPEPRRTLVSTQLQPQPCRPVDGSPCPAAVPGQVPAIDADVPAQDVTAWPSLGELGAHAFARDIATWLSRIFDAPVDAIRYRENPWDHRPCPRAQTYEITLVSGHTILITAYDVPARTGSGTVTAHAVAVNQRTVPFTERRPAVRLAWQLAWTAWWAASNS
jgi:hypothetical protein